MNLAFFVLATIYVSTLGRRVPLRVASTSATAVVVVVGPPVVVGVCEQGVDISTHPTAGHTGVTQSQ